MKPPPPQPALPKYLLDTNVWIDFTRNRPGIAAHFFSLPRTAIAVSPVVLGELHVSALKYQGDTTNLHEMEALIAQFALLPIDAHTATIYAKIRVDLERKGTPIGGNDLWIAAQAIQHNLVLITHNVKEFSRIPQLHTTDWLDN